jgi:GT2 family glycosyltransferase
MWAATLDTTQCVVCVLDNASTDGTAEEFEAQSKATGLPLRLIRSATNHGFMRGNNLAYAALCAETPCACVVLLNLDTVVHAGWWQPLVAELENPGVGSAVPLLLLPDGRVNARGNALHFLGLGFVREYGAAPGAPPATGAPIFFCSGATLAFRCDVLAALNRQLGTEGVFWDDLFLYAEDTDFGWRMRLAGLENRLVEMASVTHDHRFWQNGLEAVSDKLFLVERNRYLMLFANFRLATLVLLAPWIAASELALACGVMKLYPRRLHLWREVLRQMATPVFQARRRGIQRGRRVGDRAVLQAMTGSIRHGAIPFSLTLRVVDGLLRLSHRLLCWLVFW